MKLLATITGEPKANIDLGQYGGIWVINVRIMYIMSSWIDAKRYLNDLLAALRQTSLC